MPFKELMNWDNAKKRWHRMHNGKLYRVSPVQLGYPTRSRDESRGAANSWWEKKERELNGPFQTTSEIDDFVDSVLDGPPPGPRGEAVKLVEQLRPGLIPVSTYMKVVTAVEEQLSKPAAVTERTIQVNGEAFLNVVKGDMQPLTFRELRLYIQSLCTRLGDENDVSLIDEAQVEKIYLELRNSELSAGAKKKRWGFFRRFVKYLWGKRLIEVPRNLDAHSFEVRPQAVKTFTPEEVRDALKALKPRLQLYCLLGMNAGMTSADIGQLTKDMIDLEKGTLTRKRVKTSDNINVLTVTYRLWVETTTLLRECWSDHETLALTSMDNTALWESRQEGDKTPQKDLIHQQLKRAGAKISLKHFRAIGASTLECHPQHGRYTAHFLGHSPKSIADKYYVAPSQGNFDAALDWLHEQLFTEEKV